ncbi:hypothetical protein [Rheinheimera gaetbuli]
MPFTHACFISFSSDAGPATQFAKLFYEELKDQLSFLDRQLSIFKYDQSGHIKNNDDWQQWILPELNKSALMITIAAPTYFSSENTCLNEFRCMQQVAEYRSQLLQNDPAENDWIIAIRICDKHPMPELNNGYQIRDFIDCRINPMAIKLKRHRATVAEISDLILRHCQKMQSRVDQLQVGPQIINKMFAPKLAAPSLPDSFPSWTGVKP